MATWRSCTGISRPDAGCGRLKAMPAASCCSRPRRKCPARRTSSGCCATPASEGTGPVPRGVVGLLKATSLEHRPAEWREEHRGDQRDAVRSAFAHDNPDATIVFGVDVGRTDPRWGLPYGGNLTVDGPARRIIAHF